MKSSHFFAMISRMKYINRWGLMRNTIPENICEHSQEVAVIAHALAVIKNTRFGGSVNIDRVVTLALYHDASEILTGDLPTPVKYYNPQIQEAYKYVEGVAATKLLSLLPEELLPTYRNILIPHEKDFQLWQLIKAADKISALIKCVEEKKVGNHEFTRAAKSIADRLGEMHLPEVNYFVHEFLPSYALTLDELEP